MSTAATDRERSAIQERIRKSEERYQEALRIKSEMRAASVNAGSVHTFSAGLPGHGKRR